jgi:hypothetical protein
MTDDADQQAGASFANDALPLTRQQLHEFRLMAAHDDVVERVIAESTDDDPPSRRKVLQAIRGETGRGAGADEKCVCPDCGAVHRRRAHMTTTTTTSQDPVDHTDAARAEQAIESAQAVTRDVEAKLDALDAPAKAAR